MVSILKMMMKMEIFGLQAQILLKKRLATQVTMVRERATKHAVRETLEERNIIDDVVCINSYIYVMYHKKLK